VIMAQITKVRARSRTTASLLFRIVKAFISYLDDHGLIEGISLPKAGRVAKAPEPRTRTPSPGLLVTVWRASDARLTPQSGALLRMIILTGQRRRTVESMRWGELELDRGRWHIPASSMKSRKPHVVALGQLALALLGELPRLGPYVFSDGPKAPQRVTNIVQALRPETGSEWSAHDFRRAITTWAVARGFPRDHVKAAIGHTIVTGIDRAYDQHPYEAEAARVLLAWQAHVAELIGPASAAQVIRLVG